VARAMAQDFSWDHSAGLYTALYRRLLGLAAPLGAAAPATRSAP